MILRYCLSILVLSALIQPQELIILESLFSFPFGEGVRLSNPSAISADPQGNIYVADTGNNRILKFDRQGDLLKEVGGFGWGREQFDGPMDVCAKTGLDIFIADYNNGRIERYDRNLNYISSLTAGEEVERTLCFGYPTGVSVSSHGDLFIAEQENNRILKINSFGELETVFGDIDSGEGKVQKPGQLEVTGDGLLYVCDEAAGNILLFDYFGNYIGHLGDGMLKTPKGIFFWERYKWLFVADPGRGQIIAFDSSGKGALIQPLKNEELKPVDLVVIGDRVYVLEADRITVFSLKIDGS